MHARLNTKLPLSSWRGGEGAGGEEVDDLRFRHYVPQPLGHRRNIVAPRQIQHAARAAQHADAHAFRHRVAHRVRQLQLAARRWLHSSAVVQKRRIEPPEIHAHQRIGAQRLALPPRSASRSAAPDIHPPSPPPTRTRGCVPPECCSRARAHPARTAPCPARRAPAAAAAPRPDSSCRRSSPDTQAPRSRTLPPPAARSPCRAAPPGSRTRRASAAAAPSARSTRESRRAPARSPGTPPCIPRPPARSTRSRETAARSGSSPSPRDPPPPPAPHPPARRPAPARASACPARAPG